MPIAHMTDADDLFASGCQVLVNPVNTVGTMGKGLALAFLERYPDPARLYQSACRAGDLKPGGVFMAPTGKNGKNGQAGLAAQGEPAWIAHLATKQHWRNPSRLEWVETGAAELRRQAERLQLKSIACPALGAGLGGLDWPAVARAIEQAFAGSDIQLMLYPPKGAPSLAGNLATKRPAATGEVALPETPKPEEEAQRSLGFRRRP